MQTTLWLSLGLVLGCLTARADMANPLMRYIHPQVAFLGGQDHPDHVFLVYVRDVGHWKTQQFESCVTPILGPEPLWLDFGRTDDKFSVIAVPKAAYEKLSEEQRKAPPPRITRRALVQRRRASLSPPCAPAGSRPGFLPGGDRQWQAPCRAGEYRRPRPIRGAALRVPAGLVVASGGGLSRLARLRGQPQACPRQILTPPDEL